MLKPTVVIVGSGGAALSAAIEAAAYDVNIIIVTKNVYRNNAYTWSSQGGCTWKTHGFNAAVHPGDSIQNHIQDTLKGGGYANNLELATTLCEGAVELVTWLTSLGIKFEVDEGGIITRPFGGCDVPRSVFIEDRLGFHIQKVFVDQINSFVAQGKITIIENARATEILKNGDSVIGVKILKADTLEYLDIYARSVILADGGGATMYAPSAACADKTCDGIVMGLMAGCSIIDMEFVQFHPTGIASDILPFDGSLVEEVLRFDGGKLINKHNDRFMFNYHPKGEIATRDEVSRGIYHEILKGNAFENNSVMLDVSSCRDIIETKYPALYERLRQSGYDMKASTSILVRPTAHFLMGGIKINASAETDVEGLFAAGETAGGVHGANRLGGNGLSEALVFGRIAGRSAAEWALSQIVAEIKPINGGGDFKVRSKKHAFTPGSLINQIRREMYWLAGPVRQIHKLEKMKSILEEIQECALSIDITGGAGASYQIQQYIDLRHMILSSTMIVQAAARRKESRGAHYCDDYQSMDKVFQGFQFNWVDNSLVLNPCKNTANVMV